MKLEFFFFLPLFCVDVEGGNPFWETRQKKAPQLDDDDEDNNNNNDKDRDDEDDEDDNNNDDGEEAFILLSMEQKGCPARRDGI